MNSVAYLSADDVIESCSEHFADSEMDLSLLDYCLLQPRRRTQDDKGDLYPTIVNKAAILAVAIIDNKPFRAQNVAIAHYLATVFLLMNGRQLQKLDADEVRTLLRGYASGTKTAEDVNQYYYAHLSQGLLVDPWVHAPRGNDAAEQIVAMQAMKSIFGKMQDQNHPRGEPIALSEPEADFFTAMLANALADSGYVMGGDIPPE